MELDFVFELKNVPKVNLEGFDTLFIVNQNEKTPNFEEFLAKIAQAVNKKLDVNCKVYWADDACLVNLGPLLHGITNLISFGVEIDTFLPNMKSIYKYVDYRMEGLSLLYADSIQEVMNDTKKKKDLWTKMKEQF